MKLGLAPMDGITDCATRLITRQIFEQYKNDGDQLQLWTEFMNADGFIINPSKVIRHLQSTPEQKVIAQIYGGNAETLAQTATILSQYYSTFFAGIELNMGCPSGTVMKTGGGSEMLRNREDTIQIIKNLSRIVKSTGTLQFSIKTRAGLHEADKPDQLAFLQNIAPYCDRISIHGRTLKQGYRGDADFEFIQQVKDSISSPVFANGGIQNYQHAQELLQQYPFDGVLIGQRAIGNPWIFTPHEPSKAEIFATIAQHVRLMITCDLRFEEASQKIQDHYFPQPTLADLQKLQDQIDPEKEYRGIVEFRKHLFQYIKGIPNSRDWKQSIIPIKTLGALQEALDLLAHRDPE